MNILFFITSAFFFVWILRNSLFWIALWQLKEYRFDRMLAHIKETSQGRHLFFSPFILLKLLGIFGYFYLIFHVDLLPYYQLYIFFIFAYETAIVVKEISSRRFKRPVLTVKSLFVLSITLILATVLYTLPLFEQFVWLLITDRLIALFIAILILILSIPSEFYRDLQAQKAVRRLKEYEKKKNRNLLVIGVTGSYGKSSTKEYISQILERKFKVVKTQGTNNTLIGVVNTVLYKLKRSTDILVVEMGAYKRGEIAQICKVIKPKIGVLTAVSDQHLSLFGSFENIMKTKYELVESLPKDGLVLINGNNDNAYKLYQQTRKNKVLYQCLSSAVELNAALRMIKSYAQSSIFAYNIVVGKNSVTFDVFLKNNILHLSVYLLGEHNVENLLPGIFLADYLGMSEKEIKKAVSLITPLSKTMVRHQFPNGASVVDDTFNASSAAVIAALEYMKIYKGKKIFVMQPLIELGKNAKEEHVFLGRKIGEVCDCLFLTNNNFYSFLSKGVREVNTYCRVDVPVVSDVAEYISKNLQAEDVVVFEGKEAGNILDKII